MKRYVRQEFYKFEYYQSEQLESGLDSLSSIEKTDERSKSPKETEQNPDTHNANTPAEITFIRTFPKHLRKIGFLGDVGWQQFIILEGKKGLVRRRVDFILPKYGLVIEIDGDSHDYKPFRIDRDNY